MTTICTRTITHDEMEYRIILLTTGEYEVRDTSGLRPIGLRTEGPWFTEHAAESAVKRLSRDEAEE